MNFGSITDLVQLKEKNGSEMKRIYIFGVGKGKEIIQEYLIKDNVELLGYIDNNAERYAGGIDGKKVIHLEDVEEFDYIIVSVMKYRYIDEQLSRAGIRKDKVIRFFSFDDALVEDFWCMLDKKGWRMEVMSYEFEKKVRPYNYNLIYELNDRREAIEVIYPKILPAEEAVREIIQNHKSLSRFGDYEFALMHMKRRAKYQVIDPELAYRLREIIRTDREDILIAIADNYGSLERYTQEAAEDIRLYMNPEVRREHMDALDLNKTYYDAYLSRPYILYKDKVNAGKRFEALKQIWKNQDVLIVEGAQTRWGVGNDLLDAVRSVRRIIAPSENAFSRYQDILSYVKKVAANELILIALGATATVLAYDLSLAGLWAVDIGHLDLEYEWYRADLKEKGDISYKYVNEVNKGNQVTDLPDEFSAKYEEEIICNLA